MRVVVSELLLASVVEVSEVVLVVAVVEVSEIVFSGIVLGVVVTERFVVSISRGVVLVL